MAQISATEQKGMQQIDLTTLNIQQLYQLKQQLDQELNLFQESLASLKMAQGKYQNSGEALEKITPQSEGQEILVPLTGSMYVPGKLHDTNNVIIDIGTRYYVEKDVEGAKDYFQRKVKFVTEQMEKIQWLGLEKSKIRDAVVEIAEMKVAQQQQQQS
ncbi:prefoldin subunit 5 [Diorhabda carinulata]|uniref:prefoldin subunit 5 n=1 Tax=Diorhabda sublineata TaxID=1163346 RepID=UPI0024E0FEA2|nr:prefoldin subunit 5 [Diorhabda sublineata]XP_057656589.1 prefoldin subunit 5 [Diorhabda carinulata]